MRSLVFHPIFFTLATVYLTYRAWAASAEGIGLFTGIGLGVLWLGVIIAWLANRARVEVEPGAEPSETAASNLGRDER